MRRILTALANGLMRPVGFEVRRIQERVVNDPFWVQQQLVSNPQPVIFDVGAHLGLVTHKYRSLFPQARLHSFEPSPETFQKLEERFHGDSGITCNAVGVSDVEGTIEFNLNAGSQTNSILKTAPQGATFWGENLLDTREVLQVPTVTIDGYCRAHAIDRVDILKLDIQGAELKALHGARQMLESKRIDLIYMEMIFAATYQDQPVLTDYLNYFDAVGYTLLDVFNPVRKEFHLIQSDLIWVPKVTAGAGARE